MRGATHSVTKNYSFKNQSKGSCQFWQCFCCFTLRSSQSSCIRDKYSCDTCGHQHGMSWGTTNQFNIFWFSIGKPVRVRPRTQSLKAGFHCLSVMHQPTTNEMFSGLQTYVWNREFSWGMTPTYKSAKTPLVSLHAMSSTAHTKLKMTRVYWENSCGNAREASPPAITFIP